MYRILLVVIVMFSLACNKEDDNTVSYTFQYKLSGLYHRDSTITSDGYKSIRFGSDGSYCWTRVYDGVDTNICYGKYYQTSDTSFMWENSLVTYKATILDTIPKGMILQINGPTPVPPMFGYYQ